MTIIYTCNHCHTEVGRIAHENLDLSKIGWNVLSEEERMKFLTYTPDQSLTVKTICESCQLILDQNPHYHELDFFIQ
ncbi:anti-sigma-F factor Fin [Saliterribacillus persicus]|uniref:Uncharacterized protein DUF2757 n=1 Tax=Saliterribacillus persicus TaxID=930114 RepID=A0A368X4X2_9BACI|nr:anti-sigma-F factor Fin [Saliterribacillus persicus]RCW63050.1 uncharacterized protein DUF2757 [Saliterribacillus persicus]